MRLEKLQIEGFGHFHNHVVGPFEGNIIVLQGPNEAGKSTLLAFIRTILFGFPLRGRDAFYPPLQGGRHGGHMDLIDESEKRYTLQRFAGPRGGTPDLRTEAGEIVPLDRLVGHATLSLFKQVFAFSLDEMQSEDLMNNSEISERLYGLGMGFSGLPEFSGSLSAQKEKLFRTRGSSQVIPRLLNELGSIQERLTVISGNADEYRRLAGSQQEIEMELTRNDEERAVLGIRLAEARNLLGGWDDWVSLEQLEQQIQELPDIRDFPDNAIERLDALEERVRQHAEDLEEAGIKLQKTIEEASASISDEGLMEESEKVEAIRRQRTSFDNSIRDLPKRQVELRELKDSLSEHFRGLGNGWDDARLDALDMSLDARQQAGTWRDELIVLADKASSASVLLAQNAAQLEELEDEVEVAQSKLKADADWADTVGLHPVSGRLEDLLRDKETVERIRRGRGSFDASVRDLPKRQSELVTQRADLNRQLRQLGQDWDEQRLADFEASMVFRKEIDRFKQRLAEHAEELRSSAERQERGQSDLEEARAALQRAQSRLPEQPPEGDASEVKQKRNALRSARSRLDEYERANDRLENLKIQLESFADSNNTPGAAPDSSSLLMPVILGLAGVILAVVGIILGEGALLVGLVGGVALLGAAVALGIGGRGGSVPTETVPKRASAPGLGDAETSVKEARAKLMKSVQPLVISVLPTADVLDNAEAELEGHERVLSEWEELHRQVKDAQFAVDAHTRKVERAEELANSAVESDAATKENWRDWLGQQGLESGLMPDGVMEFIGRTETAKAVLNGVRDMEHRIAAIQADIDGYGELVQPLAERCGIPLNEDDHRRIMSAADTLSDAFETIQTLVLQRDDVVSRLRKQKKTVSAASSANEDACEERALGEASWHDWLRKRDLDEKLTPEAFLQLLDRAETARSHRSETRRMQDRVNAIQEDIDEFRDRLAPLALRYGRTIDTSDFRQIRDAADLLINRLEAVREKVSMRGQLSQQEKQERHHYEQLERRLKSSKGDLELLLNAGGVAVAEHLRSKAAQHAKLQKLQSEREKCLNNLSRLSGPNERLEAFRESLAASNPDLLSEESRELSEKVESLDSQRDELLQRHGANSTKIEDLAAEEESSQLRIQRNILMQQLKEDAQEWSRLTIAEEILKRTQRKFEQERQPTVIRHAREFFSEVTGQRYTSLYAPIGEKTITVTEDSGRNKQPSELSRGTREQLYLALRFGLIREFGEHAERLPVVVDEALVNFDPERASLAASAFLELSKTNQVLVFTCHPTITEQFEKVGAQVLSTRGHW